jgi:hypothetical protein
MIISRRGAAIPIKDVTPSEKRLINKELIVSPLSLNDVFPKKFRVFRTDDEYIYVPRFWAKKNITRPITEDFGHVEKMISVEFKGVLRKDLEQDKATDALLASLRTNGGGVLSLDTGFGKTISSIYTSVKLGLKTLILVHKDFLAEQFEESIRKFAPEATISRIKGAVCDTSGDFVICMIQTLLSRKYNDCWEGFGTLILDEAHHVAAESFTSAMFFTSFKYVIALTATPTRKDGLTRVLYWLFGEISYEARRTGQGNVKVRVVPFTCPEFSDPPPLNKRGDICYSSLMSKICDIPERTQLIAAQAKILNDMGKYALVLSHRRQHAMDICSELKTLGVDAATYLGGDKSEPDCKVLCATYALASEGYDNPRLSGLVLATPSSDVVQAVGRILRGGAGSSPIIVDIYDKYSLFMSQLAKRRAFYKKIGFSVDGEVPKEKKEIPEEIMFIDD